MMIQTGISQGQDSTAKQEETSRPMARFVLLTDLSPKVVRAGQPQVPSRVSWTLISANNRPLGRAAVTFGSLAEGHAAIELLSRQIEHASTSVVLAERDPNHRPSWTWTVRIEGRPVAVAAFRYARRYECEGSLNRFLAAVAVASAEPPTVFRVGSRLRDSRR